MGFDIVKDHNSESKHFT